MGEGSSKAKQAMQLRNGPEYGKAMELLRRDLGAEESLESLKVAFTIEAVEGLSSCG